MEFRKSYTLSLGDYLSYNRFSHRRQLMLMPALFVLLMLVTCLFVVFVGHAPDPMTIAIVVALVVVFGGLITLVNILMLNSQASRQYQASAALKSEFELVMDRSGIRETGAGGSSKASWSQVIYTAESRRAIYVHITAYRAFVIPKALLSAEEETVIRQLISAHLAGRKRRVRR